MFILPVSNKLLEAQPHVGVVSTSLKLQLQFVFGQYLKNLIETACLYVLAPQLLINYTPLANSPKNKYNYLYTYKLNRGCPKRVLNSKPFMSSFYKKNQKFLSEIIQGKFSAGMLETVSKLEI